MSTATLEQNTRDNARLPWWAEEYDSAPYWGAPRSADASQTAKAWPPSRTATEESTKPVEESPAEALDAVAAQPVPRAAEPTLEARAAAPVPKLEARPLVEAAVPDSAPAKKPSGPTRHIEDGARIVSVYTDNDLRIGRKAVVSCAAARGDIVLDEGCRVKQWIDCEGDVLAAANCDLGRSASARGQLLVGNGTTFRRLWGFPVMVAATAEPFAPAAIAPPGHIDNYALWASRDRVSLPPNSTVEADLVTAGDLCIGANAVINGDVRAGGHLEIAAGARISGSVTCARNLRLLGDVHVAGDVTVKGDIWMGGGCRVGAPHAHANVVGQKSITLMPNVTVYGFVQASQGGVVGRTFKLTERISLRRFLSAPIGRPRMSPRPAAAPAPIAEAS